MRNARCAIVFLVILTLGLSLEVVAENLPETAFDESEMQLYVSTLMLFSIVVPQVAARERRTKECQRTRTAILSPSLTVRFAVRNTAT